MTTTKNEVFIELSHENCYLVGVVSGDKNFVSGDKNLVRESILG